MNTDVITAAGLADKLEVTASATLTSLAPASRRRLHLNNLLWAALFVGAITSTLYVTCEARRTYTVIDVYDGDTFVVQNGGLPQVVQLAGADAPEIHKDETFAQQAKYYLAGRILQRAVRLDVLDPDEPYDRKNRWVCWVCVDGENLNYTMVERGLARFSGAAEGARRADLLALEDRARSRGRGMWVSPTGAEQ